jgi:hypothetical protein
MGLLKRILEEQRKRKEQEEEARRIGFGQTMGPSSFVAYPGQAPIGYNKGGVVGEHRKMFREPGLARQALGILASSKDLMQQAQPQPRMRMAQAGAVDQSMFAQATRMVDDMIASGKAPAANRDAAINNLYRYYENQQQQQAPAPRMQGYMNPQSGPIDTTAARGIPAAVGGAIAGFKGAGIGSMLGPEQVDTPAPAQPGDSGGRSFSIDGLSRSLDPGSEMERREQRALAESVFKEAGGQDEVSASLSSLREQRALAERVFKEAGGQDEVSASPISVDDEVVKANQQAAAEQAAANEAANKAAAAKADAAKADAAKKAPDEQDGAVDTAAGNADSDDNAVVADQWEQWKETTGNQNKDDFWNAIMMAGLGIAAGQSDDAVTNIAAGAIAGLKQYNSRRDAREQSMFTRFMQEKELELLERKTAATEKTADAAYLRSELGLAATPTDQTNAVRVFSKKMTPFDARMLYLSNDKQETLTEIQDQQAYDIMVKKGKKPGDPITPKAGGTFKVNRLGKVVRVPPVRAETR